MTLNQIPTLLECLQRNDQLEYTAALLAVVVVVLLMIIAWRGR
jgi:hypothetical protein